MVKILLYLVIIIIVDLEEVSCFSRSSFGEPCNKTVKCDRKAWLTCFNEVCNCSKQEEMHYDEDLKKCLTISGERCKYGAEPNEERSLVEITDCVPNSECSEDGICVCDSKYHEISNGTCALSRIFGEICSAEDKCSKFQKLHCVDGICSCQEGISSYSETHGQCVGALNQACIDGKCFQGSECKNGTCSCDVDHYEDSLNTTCLRRKRFNEKCSSDSECVNKGLFSLKCKNGICGCREGYSFSKLNKQSIPEEVRNTTVDILMENDFVEICAPNVGVICPNGYCVTNAKCTQKGYYSTCDCIQPYYANKDKTKCGRKWADRDQAYDYISSERKCEISEDCLNNLLCYNGRCTCSSSMQKVSDDAEYCVFKVGGICEMDSTCINNAFCKVLPNTTVGHCQCKPGYVEDRSGECTWRSHGAICSYRRYSEDGTRDKVADLECIDKKWSCRDPLMNKYSESARKCLGLVGATCTEKDSCVHNAECFNFNDKLQGRCKCKKGYSENTRFTCDPIGFV